MALIETASAAPAIRGKDAALQDWVRALEATAPIARHPQRILPTVIDEQAARRSQATVLLSATETMTYGALAARANRYARWALDEGLGKGEVVALLMANRPEYLAIWLGLTKVGAVVALINIQLRGASLAHCIDAAAPKHLIVAGPLHEAFASAADELSSRPKLWSHGGGDYPRLDETIEDYSPNILSESDRPRVTIADRALLIYTSGTTGLPKAANVSHRRLMQWSLWFAGLMNTGPDDRMYDCLPMYHSIGGVVAVGSVLVNGGSVVIREKFSAQRFWRDIRDTDCTLFQYIGELCRYLVNAPRDPHERDHRLRLCCGNGLRADIWGQFQSRFGVPRMLEFYAATEGNVPLYNVEGKVGSIGRVPSFLSHRFPLALVQFDHTTGEPSRNAEGFCARCAAGEAGEALGRITKDSGQSAGAFEGYTSAPETERKILRDVFARGDAWYRTGDLMRADASGFLYFVDRIGDTFRWKGENVAASEVDAVIAAFPGIAEAVVYGVAVPGTEGAAGMATLVTKDTLDLGALRDHLGRRLPPYARPLFLRIKDQIEITATFKHRKNDLVQQGYDPAATNDPIYFDDPAGAGYVPLTATLYQRIQAGQVRV